MQSLAQAAPAAICSRVLSGSSASTRPQPPPAWVHDTLRQRARMARSSLCSQVQSSSKTCGRRRRRRLDIAASLTAAQTAGDPAEEELKTLRALRAKLSEGHSPAEAGSVTWGLGIHQGMQARWRLHELPDGSFFEEIMTPTVSHCWGYSPGICDGSLWEVDHVGLGHILELDDREVILLSTWVKTGFWLSPLASSQLDIRLAPAGSGRNAGSGEGGTPELCFYLRIRNGGRVTATLQVCALTGLPKQLTAWVCGDSESWIFSNWSSHLGSGSPGGAASGAGAGPYPGSVVHVAAAGSVNSFRTDGSRAGSGLKPGAFSPPAGSLMGNQGGSFDPRVPPEVPVERTRSGHTLVRLALDGRDAGLCILDTGASGFVISRATADAFGLKTFGEVFVSGVGSKIRSRFRMPAQATVGPLTIDRPVMLEMELTGVVSGASGPVVGIVGYDLFRRAVVELPPAGVAHIRVLDPAAYAPARPLRWLALAMVSNVPHLWARFPTAPPGSGGAGAGRGAPVETALPELLMIDSGAGGSDAIFHARAVERLGLISVGTAAGSSRIVGVSGSGGAGGAFGDGAHAASVTSQQSASVATVRRVFPSLTIVPGPGPAGTVKEGGVVQESGGGADAPYSVGVTFRGVEAQLLPGSRAFDLSEHMTGVVCMPLLARRSVVLDVGRRRMALVPKEGEQEEGEITMEF